MAGGPIQWVSAPSGFQQELPGATWICARQAVRTQFGSPTLHPYWWQRVRNLRVDSVISDHCIPIPGQLTLWLLTGPVNLYWQPAHSAVSILYPQTYGLRVLGVRLKITGSFTHQIRYFDLYMHVIHFLFGKGRALWIFKNSCLCPDGSPRLLTGPVPFMLTVVLSPEFTKIFIGLGQVQKSWGSLRFPQPMPFLLPMPIANAKTCSSPVDSCWSQKLTPWSIHWFQHRQAFY